MVGKRRVLDFNGFQPGIFARRLIEMSVDTNVPIRHKPRSIPLIRLKKGYRVGDDCEGGIPVGFQQVWPQTPTAVPSVVGGIQGFAETSSRERKHHRNRFNPEADGDYNLASGSPSSKPKKLFPFKRNRLHAPMTSP